MFYKRTRDLTRYHAGIVDLKQHYTKLKLSY